MDGCEDGQTRHQLDLAHGVEFVVELDEEEGENKPEAGTEHRSSTEHLHAFRGGRHRGKFGETIDLNFNSGFSSFGIKLGQLSVERIINLALT